MGGIGVPGAHPFKNTAPAVPTKMILGEVLMNPPVFIFTYNRRGSGARPEGKLVCQRDRLLQPLVYARHGREPMG